MQSIESKAYSYPVTELGNQQTNLTHKTEIILKSKYNAYSAKITCLMIRCITGDMPNMAIDLANLRIPKNLTLADPQFYRSRSIDLLIGSALFWNLLCIDQIPLVSSLPVVQKTRLRWIVAGPMASITRMRNKTEDRCYLITTQQLHDQVAKF